MRLLCRHYNDIQLVLGGVSLMILTCLVLAIPPQAGATGLHVFIAAVFMMYSIGYPIGHTAVSPLFVRSGTPLSRSLLVRVLTACMPRGSFYHGSRDACRAFISGSA